MLSYYPLVKMFQYSLTEWNGYSPDSKFVGLDNYKTVLTNPKYFTVFKTSLYYFFATFCNWVSLYCLQRFCPLRSNLLILEGILFFPYLLNGVAIGFIFLYFFKGDGTLDTVLSALGLESQIRLWLGDRSINNISLAFTSLWRYTGFNFLIFRSNPVGQSRSL